jgi:hypothetical protein
MLHILYRVGTRLVPNETTQVCQNFSGTNLLNMRVFSISKVIKSKRQEGREHIGPVQGWQTSDRGSQ